MNFVIITINWQTLTRKDFDTAQYRMSDVIHISEIIKSENKDRYTCAISDL